MASKHVLVIAVAVTVVAIVLAAAPSPALAAELVVGDNQGWRLDVDYDDWVDGKDFVVGDTLVFKYAQGRHTVVQAATAASFAACNQANTLGMWTSGDDRIALNTSGDWWFFCGVRDHCEQGMKFNVTVLPVVKLSASSSPPARAQGGRVAAGLAGVAAAVVALLL